jgi:hypothetical protein
MPLTKDVLFYSNYCLFSKDVLSRIIKLDVKQHVVLICVDVYKAKLPSSLTVVPTLMKADGNMITDDEIYDRLDVLSNQHVPRDMFTSSGTAFAFVDDGAGDGGFGGEYHYGIFGQDQEIYTPEEDAIDIGGGNGNNAGQKSVAANNGGGNNLTYEQLQAQRDSEMQAFQKTNPRP